MSQQKIRKVLVANRGEIAIRVFRACTELGIRTVAIYSKEDTGSYHRYKADEAYLVGEGKSPIDAYLDIEGIIEIAKANEVDAIHPGYGFLSENVQFAKRCEEEGIIFIGPKVEHLDMFGDKVKVRQQAELANIPVIPGSNGPVHSIDDVKAFANQYGYPFIIKAALGGGGRGMRIVRNESELVENYERAKSEAKSSFGNDEVYVEKFIENPKHIEVQILGDNSGNIVHLYERDCSVQRRHQKVVEVAPSISLPNSLRERICEAAVRLMENVNYINAGTVEFLVTENEFYFIEVNPRVQVEHTITEMVTGIDIVQSQILIAEGHSLHSKEIGIPNQSEIKTHGYAIQCRVTTEDPENNFMPDTGKITAYRSGGGFGVRLDAGNSFAGAVITPYYDSLLVKISTHALTFKQAAAKMLRTLKEFRIRGIKTNIPFLENVITHEKFLTGQYNTNFIDQTPELFVFPKPKDRGTKMLTFIANTVVNGYPGIGKEKKPLLKSARIPQIKLSEKMPEGTKQILDKEGPEGVVNWIRSKKEVLLTDTTFRDAHQSLLATRIRTNDLLHIAQPTAKLLPNLFSVEMWGGATFDVAYRFLKEDPWVRLQLLREKMPNLLFQMLLRASNAVGYKNYPDNVIKEFVQKSAENGIDVFRIFDSLNWVKGMTLAIDAVRDAGKIAEAAICYTGDILDPTRQKYDLNYYKALAKELEQSGAHILGIKDMAGLLKPQAAYALISTLKETVDLPIHLHTHDTSGNGIYTYVKAIEAGVDIVDVAISSMAGLTSQPSANTLYYALEHQDRQPNVDIEALEKLSHYWEDVRHYYKAFESGMMAPHTEVYNHEMPGGQYSNLQQQAKAVGLESQWDDVKKMYRKVNDMFGDVVKVTPSSKVVGDMALFMVQNQLTEEDIYERGDTIDFPDSVVEFFQGYLGQPYQGFPEKLQKVILKGREPITVRPGELLENVDFEALKKELEETFEQEFTDLDVISYALYPKVFEEYQQFYNQYGDVSVLDTLTFFYGMRLGEEIEVEIEQGKTLIVKLVSIGQTQSDGTKVVYFELNGQPREVVVKDESVKTATHAKRKAEKKNPNHIGATMPGTVVKVLVEKGEKVKKGDHLMITEAMKMETTVQAPFDGVVKEIHVKSGEAVQVDDLLLELE
ncbi:pyruvate carboxylase [Calidifontibacillus erzurumensis]|uniref:Pyruvate carboxylase n=1 Tax=Calidifontibacillus erzurumensis TaxID=2741433 RepID=A0A8J8GBM5_9BACI|nr:pyruvate carboxylase [Calidifontibacillus erzurumensis]NSL50564.1 pyruvate carboxylase [Calidifontibacillus erzurumensis]